MCIKKFTSQLRSDALSAPLPYENSKGQTTFMYEKTYFRCLNTSDAIIAMANRIEKNFGKNQAFNPVIKKVNIRRESSKVVIKRWLKEGDKYNAKQLTGMTC